MKTQFVCFILFVKIIYLISSTLNPTIAASDSSAENEIHFCSVTDALLYKQFSDQYPNRRYRVSAAHLNVGEPRTVRMIYFLPADRSYDAGTVEQMKSAILEIQTFFAQQMDAHGYGYSEFRIETDDQGAPVVHRVDGGHPESHYLNDTLNTVVPETERKFDLDANSDGLVNILDLVLIAFSLGQSGQNDADVNGDGVVSVLDLVLAAGMFDEAAAAPSSHPQVPETLTAVEVQGWLTDARSLETKDPIMKRGIVVLEELLVFLTPTETELLANYPNPFNPETWIPYRLAEDAFVILTLYDLSGHVVRTLEIGHRIAAVYENRSKAIYWDGRNDVGERVASGVYFYTLTAGDYSATRKMVILK